MRTFTICLLFLINSHYFINAQTPTQLNSLLAQVRNANSAKAADILTYNDIDGSPYMSEEFKNGEVLKNRGEKITGVPLRYDIYANQVQFKRDSIILDITDIEEVKYIIMEKDTFIHAYYDNKNKLDEGYFILLHEGGYRLLLKKNILIEEAVTAQPYKDAKPACFKPAPDEYYIKHNNDLGRCLKNNKSITEIFSKNNQVLKFVKENKLSVKKKEDMVKLILFLNSL